jgi:hypothetical protein
MRLRNSMAVVMVTALVSGCPAPITKLERSSTLHRKVEIYCLIDELRGVAEDSAVRYTVQNLPGGTAHEYWYQASDMFFGWWIVVKPDGSTAITHSVQLDNASSPRMMRNARQEMLRVEATLTNRCGLGEIMATATETCEGKLCQGT